MPDMKEFKLPDVGEGLVEAEIISWKVKPGDAVKVNDIIVEIETAKSLVELPSPYAGVVGSLLAAEGDTVDVGAVIITVDTDPNGAAPAAAAAPAPTVDDMTQIGTPSDDAAVEPGLTGSPAPGGRTAMLVGYGPRETGTTRRARKGAAPATPSAPAAEVAQEAVQTAMTPQPAPTPAPMPAPTPTATPAPPRATADGGSGAGGKVVVLAKPPVRKLAKDLGVDLATVTATGPGGTISRTDVETAASGASADAGAAAEDAQVAPYPSYEAREREIRIPIKGVRKHTAAAMVASAFTAPHVTEFLTVDATRTVELVERLRKHRDFRDVRLSPLLVLARAMIIAIRRTPEVNSTWDEAAQEIVQKSYVNLGIAAATPRGLVVPNIKDADRMSMRELADALTALVSMARDGKAQPADMSGGTITITNVGVFGVDTGTPILNRGEAAIMAFGAIKLQPWVVDGAVVPRMVTTLGLAFDHRVVDGEQGSRYLADVGAMIEDPALAIAL